MKVKELVHKLLKVNQNSDVYVGEDSAGMGGYSIYHVRQDNYGNIHIDVRENPPIDAEGVEIR